MKRCRNCRRRAHRNAEGHRKACANAGEPARHAINWDAPFQAISSHITEPFVWPLEIDEALDELELSRLQHMA